MSTVRGAAVRQLAPAAEKRPAGYDTDEKSSWNQRGYCHIINFEFTLAQYIQNLQYDNKMVCHYC